MKIVSRHILDEFLRLLSITVIALAALFVVIDVVEKTDDLIKMGVGVMEGMEFFLLRLPFIIAEVSPMATLLSALISLSLLKRHGELTAIKAGGISLVAATMPIVISAILISASVIFINEYISPHASRRTAEIEKKYGKGAVENFFGPDGFWLRKKDTIYNIRQIAPGENGENALYGINAYRFDKNFALKERITAKDAVWSETAWEGKDVTIWKFNDMVTAEKRPSYTLGGIDEEISGVQENYKTMNMGLLNDYIKGLERDGYDSTLYRLELYRRITYPFANFVMAFIAIPFALLGTSRGSMVAANVGLSVALGTAYWIIYGAMTSLGASGGVPPLVSAAFPPLFFISIGAFMLGYVRQ